MRALTRSEQLAFRLSLVQPRLDRSGHALMTHPSLRRLFPEYLFRLYCAVRAVVPLMETARSRAERMAGSCPVAALLAPYLSRHIEEETGHDEWLLEDLEVLGMSRFSTLSRPPDRTVAALVVSQYYWVLHAHPVALLGYVAVFEGSPPKVEALEYLQSVGIPREALRTLYLHAELDVGHGADAERFLDCLPLSAEQFSLIGLSAMHSVEQLSLVVDQLLESSHASERLSHAS